MGDFRYINPTFLVPHYSTKLWRSYFHYLQRYYSESIFDKIIEELRMPKEYLLQDGNWVSNDFSIQFMEKLKHYTGDTQIARSVGRFNLEPENINPFEYAIIEALPPDIFFRIFPFEFRKLNQFVDIKTLHMSAGDMTFALKSGKGSQLHDESVCLGFLGSFEGISHIYKLENMNVEHTHCMHHGASECIFRIRYDYMKYWKRLLQKLSIGVAAIIGLVLISNHLKLFGANATLGTKLVYFGFVTVSFLLAFTLSKTKSILKHHVIQEEQARRKNAELAASKARLDRRYQESKLQRDLALKLVEADDQNKVIKFCIDALELNFNYKKSFIMLLSADNKLLNTVITRGLGDFTDKVANLSLAYPDPRRLSLILTKILEDGKSQLITDMETFSGQLTDFNRGLVEGLKVNSLIVAPIQSDKAKYGLVVVGSDGENRKLSKDDKYLVENITHMLSLYFQSARIFDKERSLRILFEKFVPSLVMDNFRDVDVDHPSAHLPRKRNIISIFIDIRGFTRISENKDPGKIVELLNLYFEHVTKRLQKYGGVTDNLIGDGVCGFFLDDEKTTATAEGAIRACLEIVNDFEDLKLAFSQRGFALPGLGIGMAAGEAIIGTIGSNQKLNFTAVGDVVNTASRLQEICKKYFLGAYPERSSVVVSENLLRRVSFTHDFEELENSSIRGKTESVRCFRANEETAKSLLTKNRSAA